MFQDIWFYVYTACLHSISLCFPRLYNRGTSFTVLQLYLIFVVFSFHFLFLQIFWSDFSTFLSDFSTFYCLNSLLNSMLSKIWPTPYCCWRRRKQGPITPWLGWREFNARHSPTLKTCLFFLCRERLNKLACLSIIRSMNCCCPDSHNVSYTTIMKLLWNKN